MKTISVNLYQFSELSEDAKEKALIDHANFLISQPITCEDDNGNLIEEYQDEYDREYVIESIEANEYYFFQDGEMAHCTTFTGKHERAGETICHFHGKDYKIS